MSVRPAAILAPLLGDGALSAREAGVVDEVWRPRDLALDEAVSDPSDPGPTLGILERGELRIRVEGQDVGGIQEGDVFGETTASSPEGRRQATVEAVLDSRCWMTGGSDVDRLAREASVFFDALLDRALLVMARRIGSTDECIGRLSGGGWVPAPRPPTGPGLLQSALRVLTHRPPAPPLIPLLGALPGMATAAPDDVQALAEAFTLVPLRVGESLVRQGDGSRSAWLVALGSIRVVRYASADHRQELAVLGPGEIAGALTLVVPEPRSATCVVAEEGWAWLIDPEAWQALAPPARRLWKRVVLALLGDRMTAASLLLARYLAGGPSDEELRRLLPAAGALGGR